MTLTLRPAPNTSRGVSVLGALALWSAGAIAVAQSSDAPPPALVVVDQAREERIDRLREVTGELRAVRRSRVAAETEGRVIDTFVEVGDEVTEGQPLVALDPTFVELDVRRAEAEVRRLAGVASEREVQTAREKRDLERVTRLRAQSSATLTEEQDAQSDLDEALARLEQAKAEHEVARAQLARLNETIENLTIRAPFDGRIAARVVDRGEWVDQGDEVMDVVALRPIDAWLLTPPRYVAELRDRGATAQVRVDATDELLEGLVVGVAPEADALSRLVTVRVRLDNPDKRLRPGLSVVGLVPTGLLENAITVHKDAILRDEAGAFVYIVDQGLSVPVRIKPIFAVGNRVVIRGGALPAGASVVIEGNERLFPGAPVNPTPARPGPASADADDGGRS